VTGQIYSTSQIIITVRGLQNPRQQTSSSFQLFTYEVVAPSTLYLIDQFTTGRSFSLYCSLPCKGCTASNRSACQSCYTDGNLPGISSKINLNSIDSTCVSQCPLGYYLSGTQCLLCDSNCLECTTSSTHCTSCKDNFYL
jgi:hypothetical protein